MEELDEEYEGLQETFKKLKEREILDIRDIQLLRKFTDANVTCSTNLSKIRKMLKKDAEDINHNDENYNCVENCLNEPTKCSGCAWECAKIIKQRVVEVNWHHHTKTCRKHKPGCRFGFPRFPCGYTIIAQPMKKEMQSAEAETMAGINYVSRKAKKHLKIIEEDYIARKKEDENALINGTLDEMLMDIFPCIKMSEDKKYIIIKDIESRFSGSMPFNNNNLISEDGFRRGWVPGFVGVLLLLFVFYALLRRHRLSGRIPDGSQSNIAERIINEVAHLDQEFSQEQVDEKYYRRHRENLKRRFIDETGGGSYRTSSDPDSSTK